MTRKFAGKVAVITGGSTGMRLATGSRFTARTHSAIWAFRESLPESE